MPCPSSIAETPYREFSERFHGVAAEQRIPVNGTLELTHRCNLDCVHCYCNLHVADRRARKEELDTREAMDALDQLAQAGCLWLLFTGGEPLVRPDFHILWKHARKQGMIPTLFTNATLMTPELADILAEWPPFSVEVTCYGATSETFEAVTRKPGSFARFQQGVGMLLARRIKVTLKTMVLTVNRHELAAMQQLATDLAVAFRFDAMVNARLDGSREPCSYRLAPEEVVRLDLEDGKRRDAWNQFLARFFRPEPPERLFTCGAGVSSCNINPYGHVQLCGMLPEACGNLRENDFSTIWRDRVPLHRERPPDRSSACGRCTLYSLCNQCPGWAVSENQDTSRAVDYLCAVTRERARAFNIGDLA